VLRGEWQSQLLGAYVTSSFTWLAKVDVLKSSRLHLDLLYRGEVSLHMIKQRLYLWARIAAHEAVIMSS
jgi:hypothetical protein